MTDRPEPLSFDDDDAPEPEMAEPKALAAGPGKAGRRFEARPGFSSASIPARTTRPRRLGVLPRRSVRTVAFAIISLSIFACGGLCLLAVWDYAAAGVPWRAITSLGIVAGTMGAFAFVNELFGEAEKNDASLA